MGGKKRLPPSRSLAGKKPRRSSSTVGKPSKKRRLDEDHVGKVRRVGIGPGLDVVDDFAAFRAMHSNGGNTAALRQMEVFEWIGDAVIGELVARCLLSQFHHSPLSARVFRNLRLGVVTNQNLASVFDLIGYQRHAIETRKRKTKEKADVVEAVAGEIVVRLELQKRDVRVCARLRGHLDDVIAAMLHEHFKERRRVHQKAVISGPLTVSFNAFDCLPQEHLDEETGELIIREGAIDRIDAQIHRQSEGDEYQQKSIVDLIEECEHDDKHRAGDAEMVYHSLVDPGRLVELSGPDWSVVSSPLDDGLKQYIRTRYERTSLKLRLLNAGHIFRSSREVFNVFKIYGMAVLAERVSLSLAFPHVAFRHTQDVRGGAAGISPSFLTNQRQSVLCMMNMERCATLLRLSNALGQTAENEFSNRRLCANTLRAVVGYYSAIAAEDGTKSIADDVASLLQVLAFSDVDDRLDSRLSSTPRREPLGILTGAVTETTDFMTSQVCADLHEAGERPRPTATPKLLLRQCDSETVEDLFETLARRSAHLETLSRSAGAGDDERSNRRRKRKRSESDPISKSDGKPSPNLARFGHRRFLFCLEELVILFAQRKTEECRAKMSSFEVDLEPCAGESFRKWEVSTSTLTMAIPESFHRLLLHDLCHFHALVSSSKTTRDGTRVTQLRLPLHYSWDKIKRRVTVEEDATG